jgi:hypothetical protein
MRATVTLCFLFVGVLTLGDGVAYGADADATSTWYPFEAKSDPAAGEIGMQSWLDKPAGLHGRIVRQGEKLLYNGKPVKLWGLNLCFANGCAPEKAVADKRAAFYAKYGINSVRFHKYADGPGWSGIQSKDSFVTLDPAGLDRMDYQVAKFKEAGIYVLFSTHFGAVPLGPADKALVPYAAELNTAKGGDRLVMQHSAIYYSPELQDVQIQHITNLLQHKNPHTGLTYAEDPAVAFVEIINEQSIFFYTSMAPLKASPTLRKMVAGRFCQWLKTKYGDKDKLLAAWGDKALGMFKGQVPGADSEDLEAGTILPLGNPWYWDPAQLAGTQAPTRQRHLDTLEFLFGLQRDFYQRYVEACRKAGYKGEMVGSNWQAGRAYSHFANLYTDYLVGTVDRHNYYGAGGGSMLAKAGSGLLSSGMQQVADRPFMLSEWLMNFPNDQAAEGTAILGAYGMGLQGWDVSYVFQNEDPGAFLKVLGGFDVTVPNVVGLFPAVARQVLRDDVRESDVTAVRKVNVASLFQGKLSFDDSVKQSGDQKELESTKVPAQVLAVARQAIAFTDTYQDTPVFDMKPYEKDGWLVSSTGQLRWKEGAGKQDGLFTMDTDGTKAVVGFAEGKTCELKGVTIKPECSFAAIYVTAQGKDETFAAGKKLLVVAMGRVHNTGTGASGAARGRAKGTAPILLEPVKATITIQRAGGGGEGAAKVVLLDHDGLPTDRTLPVKDGTFQIDGEKDKTPYYLVVYP